MDQLQFFKTSGFEYWAHREGLHHAEELFIRRFFRPHRRTLDAGTGGGRIPLALRARGFEELSGFDFLPEFIEIARRRDATGSIRFSVQDATSLDYPDDLFEQSMYLQQLISLIESESGRERAVAEAFRVTAPQGVALFSFLCFETRSRGPLYGTFSRYLALGRRITRRRISLQLQPDLRTNTTVSPWALLDRRPYNYLFRINEAAELLGRVGFTIIAAASKRQTLAGEYFDDYRLLTPETADGLIYFACRKDR